MRSLQTRHDGRPKLHLVRWTIDKTEYAKGFTHWSKADEYRAKLVTASGDVRERWDRVTGEPVSWGARDQVSVAQFCLDYVARESPTYEPSSAMTLVETLANLVVAARRERAPAFNPEWRPFVRLWLRQAKIKDDEDDQKKFDSMTAWVSKWSMQLDEIDKYALLRIDERLRVGVDGSLLGRRTQSRRVAQAKRCLTRAVAEGLILDLPWPEADAGRAARKANTEPKREDAVPAPEEVPAILDAIISHQPATHMYRAMTAIGFYAGLRPGEIVALTREDLTLPNKGWGQISVTKAWVGVHRDGDDPIGQTKTTEHREVPIPPALVSELQTWLDHSEIVEGPLFRTRNDNRPTQSNWRRVLFRATETAGMTLVNPYGLRHACASYLSAAGVPIAEAAARLGHSPETMLRYYVNRIAGHEALSNTQLEKFYSITNNE